MRATQGARLTAQREGVNVFPVIGAGHVLLTKANGVLALGDTIENLEVLFRDTLCIAKLDH